MAASPKLPRIQTDAPESTLESTLESTGGGLRTLQRRLRKHLDQTSAEAPLALVRELRELTNAHASAIFSLDSEDKIQLEAIAISTALPEHFSLESIQLTARTAIAEDALQIAELRPNRDFAGSLATADAIWTAIAAPGSSSSAIVFLLELEDLPLEPFAAIAQFTAAFALPRLTCDSSNKAGLGPQARTLASLREKGSAIGSRFIDGASAADVGAEACTELQACCAASHVFLFDARGRLLASHASEHFDTRTEIASQLSALARLRFEQERPGVNAPNMHNADDLEATKLSRDLALDKLVCVPIRYGSLGLVCILGFDAIHDEQSTPDLFNRAGSDARELLEPLALAIAASNRRSLSIARTGKRRWLLVGISALVLSALLLLPTTHTLYADAELEPPTRRYVVAPFAALLRESKVEPGDVVARGQVLAVLDGEELRLRLSRVLAQLRKLEQQKELATARQDAVGQQLASAEIDSLVAQREFMQSQLSQLELSSPISGVVLSGDLSRHRGAPLGKGERVFELAPSRQLLAALEVKAKDIAYVEVDMPVELLFEGYPVIDDVVLSKLHPRALPSESGNSFRAEVELKQQTTIDRLRPGLRGQARIMGQQRALGWIIFQRAYHAFVRYLLW